MALTAYQVEVLENLEYERERSKYTKIRTMPDGTKTSGWAAPIDFGGRNDSHHSHTAKCLVKKGLVDRDKYGCRHRTCFNNLTCPDKGACFYRITDEGVRVIKAHHAEREAMRKLAKRINDNG